MGAFGFVAIALSCHTARARSRSRLNPCQRHALTVDSHDNAQGDSRGETTIADQMRAVAADSNDSVGRQRQRLVADPEAHDKIEFMGVWAGTLKGARASPSFLGHQDNITFFALHTQRSRQPADRTSAA